MAAAGGVAIALVLVAIYTIPGKPAAPGMHVLLITLDTTRADHLGCYGYGRATSGNLDALAAECTQFDLAIAQAAVTPVSHASILTGLEPYHHGLRVMHGLVANRLPDDRQTIAEIWRGCGGRTAAFVSAFPVTASYGLDQGFEHFDASFPKADGEGLVGPTGVVTTGGSQRRAEQTTRAAIDWLDEHADSSRPLLMWVHYFDPHDTVLLPPQEFLDRFRSPSQERADVLRTVYDAEVLYMDHWVGRLIDAFKRHGLWDRTMVVVVADHGEGLGDHNWWTHGILYQEQIHVPLLIRIPGVKGAAHVGSLVRTIDLMPTVLEAAGVPESVWPAMDGRSLVPVMGSAERHGSLQAYSDSVNMLVYGRPDDRDPDQKLDKLYCVMNERYKLIYHQLKPGETEFYDLQTDPKELRNLAATKPPVMEALLERLMSLGALSDIEPGMIQTDLERLNRLRDLGYVQ
jgi:arylsulfatase A-like enzyme